MALTDKALLIQIVRCDDLTDDERRVFGDMLTKMEDGLCQSLSKSQRVWADGVYKRYHNEDQQGSHHLVSSGKVKKTESPTGPYPWEKGGKMAHPTRPPGR